MRAQHPSFSSSHARGFTLLEALVSVLVLTVGLLGAAGLHFASLRNTAESSQRTQATLLAIDLTERLRARAPAGTLTQLTAFFAPSGEHAQWQTIVGNSLAGGGGVLCRDSRPPTDPDPVACTNGANDPLVVKVWWRERDAQGASSGGDAFNPGTNASNFRPQLGFVVVP